MDVELFKDPIIGSLKAIRDSKSKFIAITDVKTASLYV